MAESILTSLDALILGLVEGITEYLPISSTGHLVLASELLGLRDAATRSSEQLAAIQAFEIVIQGGAILAVLYLYKDQVLRIFAGLFGRSVEGQRLARNIAIATAPALSLGYLLKDIIGTYLQFSGPVLIALVLGGVAMIVFDRREQKRGRSEGPQLELHELSPRQALRIGLLQCLALWPGTSRSMVTILGGKWVGLSGPRAAEFSFLVGLPTLFAATAYKGLKDHQLLLDHVGASAMVIGLLTSTISAVFAVKWLVAFLNRRGLAPFGWYRLILAAVMAATLGFHG